ncbi:periplasmic nitrate reductase, NapE protein [Paracoccus mangrovi]|uniref:Periplasmic nitrate reductase, NapE protein n=1 Tax=Paracoccus mangrovi TaxID=1715645 RepID=A0ABV7R3D4_9RHOB
MPDNQQTQQNEAAAPASRFSEIMAFLVLAFGIWPIVAIGAVGGYGFLVWMLQILNGPPGPPSH